MCKQVRRCGENAEFRQFRATTDTIVSSAEEQTAAAQTGQSKCARVGGIRANKKLEREHERRIDVAPGLSEEEELIEDIGPEESQEPGDESYTPFPSQLTRLARHQEELLKNS